MRVLSVTHGESVPGGVFDEAVETAGHALERWQVPDGGSPDAAEGYDAKLDPRALSPTGESTTSSATTVAT